MAFYDESETHAALRCQRKIPHAMFLRIGDFIFAYPMQRPSMS